MEKKYFSLSDKAIRDFIIGAGWILSDAKMEHMVADFKAFNQISADYAVKKVAELIEELAEDPAEYYDQLGKVATLGDLKYGLLKLLESK